MDIWQLFALNSMETSISFASLLALTISRASMWLLESLYNRFFLSIALSRKAIGHLANSGMKVCSAKLLSPRLFQVWSEYLPGLAIQITISTIWLAKYGASKPSDFSTLLNVHWLFITLITTLSRSSITSLCFWDLQVVQLQ